jgi:hypothetical protein
MMRFFSWIMEGVWWFIRYTIPVFYPSDVYRAATGRRWPMWWLHILILALVLGGLWFLNYWFDIRTYTPTANPYVAYSWLPLLFMLIYSLSWLGWWLYKLLIPEEDVSAYPDIDRDWQEAVGALRQVGIDLSEVPLFLVLGKPEGGEETFMHAAFTASQMPSLVKYAPARSDASVRLYASREAVFITCAGASLMGRNAEMMNETVDTGGGGGPGGSNQLDASVAFKTIAPTGGNLEGIQKILRQAWDEGRQVTEDEKEQIRLLTAEGEAQQAASSKKRPSIFKNAEEADRLTDRLKHVCRLIVRERRPHCPINGMLALVPFAGTDSDEDSNQTTLVIQRDLDAAVAVLKLRCPVIALVCDLERATGFREFVKRFPPDQRKQRLGHRHPWLPDLDANQLIKAIEAEVEWIYQGVLGNWTYKLFHIEDDSGKEDLAAVTLSNAQLFLFLACLRERQKRLARLMGPFNRKAPEAEEPPLLFGGCYVAGTGTGADEQAFVAGVIHRLVESQNLVAWAREALVEDIEYQRFTTYGYVGIGVFSAAIAGLGFWLWK